MAHEPALADLDPDILSFDDMKPSQMVEGADNPVGLSLLLQMTRYHDLGLGALLLDGRDISEEELGVEEEEDAEGLDVVDEEDEAAVEQDDEDGEDDKTVVGEDRKEHEHDEELSLQDAIDALEMKVESDGL